MNTIITISREYGAVGTSIGKRVAKELGIELYDRDIIRHTVLQTGLDAGVIEHDVILNFAKQGPCVLLGRCADLILEAEDIDCLKVFLYADVLHRAKRVGEIIGSDDPTAIQKAMKRTDHARRAYYQQFTGRRWGDCANYNLMLDTGLLGYDASAKLICEAARSLEN